MTEYCRILIVEDEFLLRQGIKNLVSWESEGFRVVGEAPNGKAALELIEQLNPHIVITDIVMPVMDGVELTAVIRERFPDIKVVVLSSYSEFEYIKSVMKNGAEDYILKPTMNPDTLLDAIKKAAAKIEHLQLNTNNSEAVPAQMIQKLISGFAHIGEFQKEMTFFPYKSFIMVGTDLIYVNGSAESLIKQKNLLEDYAPQFLGKDAAFTVTAIDRKYIIMLVNFKLEKLSGIIASLEALFEKMAYHFPKLFYAATPVFSSLDGLNRIFLSELKNAVNQRFYLSDRSFYYAGKARKTASASKFDEKAFSGFLNAFRLKDAFSLLLDYTEKTLSERSQQEYEIKSFLQNVIYRFISVLEDSKLNEESLRHLKQQYFLSISRAESADELTEFLKLAVDDASAIEQKYRLPSESAVIHDILDYIGEHYAEPLSLRMLADRFSFNYFYLSKYFSTHCNEGFNEYLNRIRVDKAAELLAAQEASISEICGAVGYMDHSYFTKVFKKFTGYTPKQFRTQSKKGKL